MRIIILLIVLFPINSFSQRVQLSGIPGQEQGMDITDSLNQIMAPYHDEITNLNNRRRDEELKQELWQAFRSNVNNFEQVNRYLFGYNSSFRSKTNTISAPSSLSATLSRPAQYGEHSITIRQLAQAHAFASDPVSVDKQLSPANFIITIGEKKIDLEFNGGTIQNLYSLLQSQLSNYIDMQMITASKNEKIISMTSKNSGQEYAVQFSGDTKPLEEVAFLSRGKTFETNFTWTSLSDTNMLFLTNSRTSLPISFEIPNNSTLTFSIKTSPLPEVVKEEPLSLEKLALDKPKQISQNGIMLPGASPILKDFQNMVQTEQIPTQKLVLNFSDRSNVEIPLETTNIILSLKDFSQKQLTRIDVISEQIIADVSDFELKSTPEGSLRVNNEIAKAQDAIFTLNGVELRRPKNIVGDVISGVTLDLLRADKKQQIKLEIIPDLELVKDTILQWVLEYNNIMEDIHTFTTVPFEKIGRIKPLHEREEDGDDLKEGTFFGNSNLLSFKERLRRMSSSPHGQDPNGISLLDQIGVYVRRQNSFNNDPDALRKGILTVDVNELQQALADDFEGIRDMFVYDSNTDTVPDKGLAVAALEVNKMMLGNEGYLTRNDQIFNRTMRQMNENIQKKEDELGRTERTERRALLEMNQAIIQNKALSESLQQRFR